MNHRLFGAFTGAIMTAWAATGYTAERLAAGGGHSLLVDDDGAVLAWGDGRRGQLGNGQFGVCHAPAYVRGPHGTERLENVVQVQAGRNHSLAVDAAGRLWAWGDNTFGQLGNGRSGLQAHSALPVQVLGPGGEGFPREVVAAAAGWDHSVALLRDGSVWAWGSRCQAQLGDGIRDSNRWSTSPVPVAAPGGDGMLEGVTALACGAFHTLARRADGTVIAWGDDHEGQLGRGRSAGRMYRLSGRAVWAEAERGHWSVAVGYTYTDPSHRRVANRLRLVDRFEAVEIQVGTFNDTAPPQTGQASRQRDHVAMEAHLSAPRRARTGTAVILELTEMLIGQHARDDDRAEDIHLLLTEKDSGRQVRLELVHSGARERALPAPVVGPGAEGQLTEVQAIAAGVYHSVALLDNGAVMAWGYNGTGQLGDGTRNQRSVPEPIQGGDQNEGILATIIAIAAGYEHTLAIDASGAVWACGWNVYGQLGAAQSARSPGGFRGMIAVREVRDGQPAVPIAAVTTITSGINHVLARGAGGDLIGWGHNGYAQLADGSLMDRNTAVSVNALLPEYHAPAPRRAVRAARFPSAVEPRYSEPPAAGADVVDVRAYGAAGDGVHLDQEALQASLDAAHAAGGGIVLVPPGTYRSGTLNLPSQVRLHLSEGATLLASTNRDHYSRRACIVAEGADNIAITGRGIIDGQGHFCPNRGWRHRILSIENCRQVTIEGITTRNSGSWTQHYISCHDLTIRGVTVNSVRPRRNNDGIDLSGCRDVLIEGCLIAAEDDAIVIKSQSAERVNRNIRALDNTVFTMCNGFKLGTETRGDFEDILCRDLRAYGGSTLALWSVDGANVRDVRIENVTAEDSRFALGICVGARLRQSYFGDEEARTVGSMRNVIVRRIDITMAERSFRDTLLDYGIENAEIAHQLWTRAAEPSFVVGLPEQPVRNVLLENVRISYPGGGSEEDAKIEVPERRTVYPNAGMYGTLPAWGLFLRHATGISLRNLLLERRGHDARNPLSTVNLGEDDLLIENLVVRELEP